MRKKNRKEISGDLYFFDVLGDKIIINNNYEGITIFGEDFNELKKIAISEDLCIYNSFALMDEILLLNCVENAIIYLVNVNTGEYKSCNVPDHLANKIIKCLVEINGANAVLQTYDGELCCLNMNSMEISECEHNVEKVFMKEEQLYNLDSEFVLFGDVSVKMSEKSIVFKKGGIDSTIIPDEGYFFVGLKVISNKDRSLVVFSSDEESSKAIITSYSDN